ncbi:DinB family protein [Abyssalbus ytuae]|uniref:DinB family protein n=1 Tax=Abyssalbus ytuae TaxID=2926907 RepID=A0A9E7A0G8_9FLAO|nr:DinB family protein [Abyssalbus ytuae]UOB17421.1 DinB family protein [Abyssalbus ytuae]
MNISQITYKEYSTFFSTYINKLEDVELLAELEEGRKRFKELIIAIPPGKLYKAYEKDKWSLAEVLMHCIDTERVFQYRVLRIARNDKTDLRGFNQDDFVPFSNANSRTAEDLLEEYNIVRDSSIFLVKNLTENDLLRTGIVEGEKISARAMAFIICGHQLHHEKIIRERYL